MNNERSSLISRMRSGEFIQSIQLDPPENRNIKEFSQEIKILQENGIDLVDINDSRRECMDALQLASHLSHNEMEVIPHITARDTSINGLLGQISAAYTYHDIKNILIITGDPYKPSLLNEKSKGVFQTRSIGIIKAIDNKRKDPQHPMHITIAAAVDQNAEDLLKEGKKTEAKEHAGADFFMSQPVFDKKQAQQLKRFYSKHSDKPLIAGIWPASPIRTVDNIHQGKVKGVIIPKTVYEEADKLRNNPDKLKSWAIENVRETIEYIKENNIAQGIYIVAPLRKPSTVIEILKK